MKINSGVAATLGIDIDCLHGYVKCCRVITVVL